MSVESEASPRPVERFHRLCEVVVARLPFGLDSIVAATFLGFVVLNGFTFAVDWRSSRCCTVGWARRFLSR
jgi:hypothetical protein